MELSDPSGKLVHMAGRFAFALTPYQAQRLADLENTTGLSLGKTWDTWEEFTREHEEIKCIKNTI